MRLEPTTFCMGARSAAEKTRSGPCVRALRKRLRGDPDGHRLPFPRELAAGGGVAHAADRQEQGSSGS